MTDVLRRSAPLAVILLLAVCTTSATPRGATARPAPRPTPAGMLDTRYDLHGAHLRLATRDFTEALILGQVAAQAWEAAGATVTLTENVPGTAGVRELLLAGDVDAAWDYTGAVWVTAMGNAPIRDPWEQYASVARADLRRNALVWSRPAPYDNTYGIAAHRRFATTHRLRTLADVATFVARHPDRAPLCVDDTFADRVAGLWALERAYGVDWPDDAVVRLSAEEIAPAAARGAPCAFGEVFTTDGRLPVLGLTVLEDTARAFVSHRPAVQITAEVAADHPQLIQVIDEVVAPLDDGTIAALNAAVDVSGAYPEEVAARYLRDHGFVE